LRSLQTFSEKMGWNMVAPPVESLGAPNENKLIGFAEIAEKIL